MDRKVLLVGLLGLTGIGLGADAAYRAYVETPFKKQAEKKQKLNKEKADYRSKLIQVKRLVRDLPEIQDQSLPGDPTAARQRYQAWWWQKVKSHQWLNPSVDIGTPSPIILDKKKKKETPPAYRIASTIRGTATLQQVTNLLDDFYATPLLQKIDSVQFTPIKGGQAVSVSLSISALALSSATQQSELPDMPNMQLVDDQNQPSNVEQILNGQQNSAADANLASAEVEIDPTSLLVDQTQAAELPLPRPNSDGTSADSDTTLVADLNSEAAAPDDRIATESNDVQPATNGTEASNSTKLEKPWQSIVKRNMFQAGGGMQIANQLRLSAITQNAEGKSQAWFRQLDNNRTEILDVGQQLQIGVLQFSVVQAEQRHVIVNVEGNQVRIKIGQTLGQGVVVN